MSLQIHDLEVPDGAAGFRNKDRIVIGAAFGAANAAGSGAGAAVTVAVTGLKNLPANYAVLVNPGQDATWYISAKTNTGFTINLLPRLAANTLAAGTIDWVLVA